GSPSPPAPRPPARRRCAAGPARSASRGRATDRCAAPPRRGSAAPGSAGHQPSRCVRTPPPAPATRPSPPGRGGAPDGRRRRRRSGAGEVGTGRETNKLFVKGKKVKARAKLGGKKVFIKGRARPTGEVRRVNDEFDDAGLWFTVTGTHRLLDPQAAFAWGKRATKLVCDPAF